ncbi:MAG: DUF547 domain-containing protein [Ferruginibacter sp.]
MSIILSMGYAQPGITLGTEVPDLPIELILNSDVNHSNLHTQLNNIVIIDFFGTWCAPCLRALPHLEEILKEFEHKLNIVLVSNETEPKLNAFIKARPGFKFPVIVDKNNSWNNYFQPPSLPYSVVLNGEGKVIAIKHAGEITSEDIKQWLQHKNVDNTLLEKENNKFPLMINNNSKSDDKIIQLSQDIIYSVKTGENADPLFTQLKNLDYTSLQDALVTDNDKKAFWINIYNAYTQAALKKDSSKYQNRNKFFKAKGITVAGRQFSLDDIEHGILRRSKVKWSLGYFGKLFPSKKEKQLRVSHVDYRIHFALNCGAKSCPPVAFYNPATLDNQLNLATYSYLSGEAEYDDKANIIRLPALMSWFRADFGGKKGMLAILRNNNIIKAGEKPRIKFKKYDWTLSLNNYKN